MNHEAYVAWRSRVSIERPELLDLGELNVYRSLGPSFPRIGPSTDREAPHRCHLAERFLDQLGLDRGMKPRTLISHGVRRSLAAWFACLAEQDRRVAIPSDVYPTYLALARDARLSVVTYEARLGLPALGGIDAILVCDPQKPWGGRVDLASLVSWASEQPDRQVLVDAVYATPPDPRVLTAAVRGEIVLLTSLSKGWLLPDHLGLCIVPEALVAPLRASFARLDKDETKLRVSFAALTTHAQRPAEIRARLDALAARLDDLTRARPELGASRCDGYFAISTRSHEDLLREGVIAAPASVFGGPSDRSILSSLPPTR